MSNEETKHKIEDALKGFDSGNLTANATRLFNALGYASEKRLTQTGYSPEEFLNSFNRNGARPLNPAKALVDSWKHVHFLFQLTADEIKASSQLGMEFGSKNLVDSTIMESYLFFALELAVRDYTRSELAAITREINKIFNMPVMILFHYGASATLAIIDRRLNKIDETKDVLQKVTLIKDINITQPHRAHIEILFDLSLNELRQQYRFTNFVELHRAWQKALGSSELNKKFFRELSNWYFWALQNVTFPKDAGADAEVRNATSVIRLITRLIFIWFIKEKNLVPDELFNKRHLDTMLKYDDPMDSTYYKAILQNLFFATLNQEMNTSEKPNNRQFRGKSKQSNGRDQHCGITNLYRYEDYFRDSNEALKIFSRIPFLNGGLFECLDKLDKTDPTKMLRIDGFSDHKDNEIYVPDYLFFSGETDVDLSEAYGVKNKWEKVRGLINILERYKFTINENTPIEEEVALDPELLGKVFENLLASYNSETQTTARKSTGSHYTPREIVNHMVDESLIAYLAISLKEKLPTFAKTDRLADILREVFAYKEDKGNEHYFNTAETNALIDAIDKLKALDPACGSGAFPMGILHKLVYILGKLDPHNKLWKERQLASAANIEDPFERDKITAGIEDSFERNEMDYGRKLYLIQNCIYGVDIQPIAVQIAKLRFFISLVVDQKLDEKRENRGILPLPNLETKFVAANTLIGLEKPQQGILRMPEVTKKEEDLKKVRQRYFTARSHKIKRECREKDTQFRHELSKLLVNDGFTGETALKVANWDPYDQNAHAEWFDAEWMFGVNGGFDIIIANPPYIFSREQLSERDKAVYKSNYSLTQFKINLYILFIEKSFNLLNNTGTLVFITPNNWLTLSTTSDLRHFLLTKTRDIYIVLNYAGVFENASVDTCILGFGKIGDSVISSHRWTERGVELIRVQLSDHYLNKVGNVLSELEDAGSGGSSNICNKIDACSTLLSDIADVKNGVQAYTVGEGDPIQTEEMKISRVYHSNIQKNKTWIKYLDGVDVARYRVGWSGQFIKYGTNLTRPREPFLFLGDRLLVRQIPGQLPYCIHACYIKEHAINDNNSMIIRMKNGIVNIKYVLGIINSKLVSFWFAQTFGKLQRKIFPQFKVKELRTFPIKVASAYQLPSVLKVDQILSITKDEDYLSNPTKQAKVKELEAQIDQLVYQLYELTPEEIAVVEGKAKK